MAQLIERRGDERLQRDRRLRNAEVLVLVAALVAISVKVLWPMVH